MPDIENVAVIPTRMPAQAKANEVSLFYDPNRGGFVLTFFPVSWDEPHLQLFDRLMVAEITKNLRVGVVNSCWDNGGLLLNDLYTKPDAPCYHQSRCGPRITLTDGLTQLDGVLVRQTTRAFELWFGSAPVSQPPTYHDSNTSVSVWLATERVRHPYFSSRPDSRHFETNVVLGLRVEFSRLAVAYPLKTLWIGTDDDASRDEKRCCKHWNSNQKNENKTARIFHCHPSGWRSPDWCRCG